VPVGAAHAADKRPALYSVFQHSVM